MTSFIWSGGHLGWPLFGILVLSCVCLLAADGVWRCVRLPFWKLCIAVGGGWVAGIIALVALYFA